jgi:hypothetical protein
MKYEQELIVSRLIKIEMVGYLTRIDYYDIIIRNVVYTELSTSHPLFSQNVFFCIYGLMYYIVLIFIKIQQQTFL